MGAGSRAGAGSCGDRSVPRRERTRLQYRSLAKLAVTRPAPRQPPRRRKSADRASTHVTARRDRREREPAESPRPGPARSRSRHLRVRWMPGSWCRPGRAPMDCQGSSRPELPSRSPRPARRPRGARTTRPGLPTEAATPMESPVRGLEMAWTTVRFRHSRSRSQIQHAADIPAVPWFTIGWHRSTHAAAAPRQPSASVNVVR